jgi:hypothetical protein
MEIQTASEEYTSGWTEGYDANETEWAMRTMNIARKLIDRVDDDARSNGYLDIEAIESVVVAFWNYAEHGEVVDILDNYIEWCAKHGTAHDMKRLMELKLTGRIANA